MEVLPNKTGAVVRLSAWKRCNLQRENEVTDDVFLFSGNVKYFGPKQVEANKK